MKSILLYLSMLGLTIIGATLGNSYIGIISVLLMGVLIYFVVKNRLQYPRIFLFCLALALLYQTTLLSSYLIGTDIHGEFYYAWLTLKEGWNPNRYAEYNIALGSTVVPALISYLTKLDLYIVFKWIMPIFLALTPVILYNILKRFFPYSLSLMACIFFIVMPAFYMELSGIVKEMVGELLLLLVLWILLSGFKLRVKIPLLTLFCILTVVTHYSMAIVLIILLSGMFIVLLITDRKTLTWLVLGSLLLISISSFLWFSNTAQGRLAKVLLIQGEWQVQRILNLVNIKYTVISSDLVPSTLTINSKADAPVLEAGSKDPATNETVITEGKTCTGNITTIIKENNFFSRQEPVIQSALGLDLLTTGTEGFIFRLLQYSTQLSIIIGSVYLLINWRKQNRTFLALFFSCGLLLTATVLLPNFSSMMNASRLYHLSLIGLCISLPVFLTNKNYYLLILLPYFLFCSGLVYEVMGSNNISELNIPYSKGLSASRTDIAGVFTNSDIEVRDYIVENNLVPVYGDFNGTVLLIEKMGWEPFYLEDTPNTEPLNKSYLFLRSRNTVTNTFIYWSNVGLRKVDSIKPEILNNRSIVFQSGNSIVYGPKKSSR